MNEIGILLHCLQKQKETQYLKREFILNYFKENNIDEHAKDKVKHFFDNIFE